MSKTRIKAKLKKGVVTVRALSKHPMLSYAEAKRAKKEANFITYYKASVNDIVVYELSSSQFLSKDPYMKFSFRAEDGIKKGDKVTIEWSDLKGKSSKSSKKIK